MKRENTLSTTLSKRTKNLSSILGPIALGIALAIVAVLVLLALPADKLSAQGPDEAHVIVQLDGGDVVGRHIDFAAPISGLKALELTSLDVITHDFGWGIGVCSIGGVGCPESDCFCDPTNFWNYYYWDGSAWQSHMVGADSSAIGDGAVEGWRWGPWGLSMPTASPILAAVNGLEYLRPLQSASDGGYGAGSATAETLFAVAANGYQAAEWRRQVNGPSLMSYFLVTGTTYANSGAGPAGKMAVALAAGNGCWPQGAMEPISYYHASTGAYSSTNPFDTGTGAHAWGMLGTAALSQTVPPSANQYLKDLQKANGGWEWDIGFGTDTNSTALAVQALVASGEPTTSLVILDALTYLKSTQNIADGGFPYNPDGGWPGAENSDTNSTAYVVQALLAAGQDPTTGTWVVASSDPISYLLSMQLPDGSFEWQTGFGSDLLGTRQAIPALLGRSLLSAAADLDQSYVTYLPMTFKRFQ